MKLARDLLEQADRLARLEVKRPKQASLRRSTSTAYYALFHLLCQDAALIFAPNLPEAARAQLQRCFDHSAIKVVCARFLQPSLPRPLASLVGAPVSSSLRTVALSFVQLQEARHSADYDLNSTWDRAKAAAYVQKSRDAFAAWASMRRQREANVFLLCFLLLRQFEAERYL